MSELQVGGLALVVGYTNIPKNLGKVVTLDRFVNAGEVLFEGVTVHDYWLASGDYVGYTVNGEDVNGSIGLFKPEHLMPIKPEADPLDVTHKEELHA